MFIVKELTKEFVWISTQFNPKSRGVQNPIMRKCLFLSVFTVFSGGWWIMGGGGGGVHIYVYTYTYIRGVGLRVEGVGCRKRSM